jgi:hypothetical protein
MAWCSTPTRATGVPRVADESRTGLTTTVPSSSASNNMPERQARADLAAPAPLLSAITRIALVATRAATSLIRNARASVWI